MEPLHPLSSTASGTIQAYGRPAGLARGSWGPGRPSFWCAKDPTTPDTYLGTIPGAAACNPEARGWGRWVVAPGPHTPTPAVESPSWGVSGLCRTPIAPTLGGEAPPRDYWMAPPHGACCCRSPTPHLCQPPRGPIGRSDQIR